MAFVSTVGFRPSRAHNSVQARPKRASTSFARIRRGTVMTTTVVEKGAGMRLIKDADEEMISKLGCRSWSTWGCDASSFPWTYSDDEVCFVLEGEVRVIPDDGSEPMDVKAGDIAYFPKNMTCKWDVRKRLKKHYTFGIQI